MATAVMSRPNAASKLLMKDMKMATSTRSCMSLPAAARPARRKAMTAMARPIRDETLLCTLSAARAMLAWSVALTGV